jgi:hypothetical protein
MVKRYKTNHCTGINSSCSKEELTNCKLHNNNNGSAISSVVEKKVSKISTAVVVNTL